MSEEKLDEIEKKKKQLQAELDQIQDEIDHSLDEVRSDVSKNLRPTEIIKNYPLPTVGLAIVVGFLVGHRPKGESSYSSKSSSGDGFSSLLLSELKKLATRKAVSAATDYIDQLLETKKEETLNPTNETEEED